MSKIARFCIGVGKTPVSALYELMQKGLFMLPEFEEVNYQGPPFATKCTIHYKGQVLQTQGMANTKKESKQRSAAKMIKKIQKTCLVIKSNQNAPQITTSDCSTLQAQTRSVNALQAQNRILNELKILSPTEISNLILRGLTKTVTDGELGESSVSSEMNIKHSIPAIRQDSSSDDSTSDDDSFEPIDNEKLIIL